MMDREKSKPAFSMSARNGFENGPAARMMDVSTTGAMSAGRRSCAGRQAAGSELTKCVRQMTGLTG
jgi:hypothetical protein